jgi:Arc/MetJ-type ribon-helix-helix transcriptional regulator
MDSQIAIRLSVEELKALDAEVSQGRAASRSEAVRRSIAYLQRQQRYRDEEATLIEIARRSERLYPDLEGLLNLPYAPLD